MHLMWNWTLPGTSSRELYPPQALKLAAALQEPGCSGTTQRPQCLGKAFPFPLSPKNLGTSVRTLQWYICPLTRRRCHHWRSLYRRQVMTNEKDNDRGKDRWFHCVQTEPRLCLWYSGAVSETLPAPYGRTVSASWPTRQREYRLFPCFFPLTNPIS